LIRLAVIPCVL